MKSTNEEILFQLADYKFGNGDRKTGEQYTKTILEIFDNFICRNLKSNNPIDISEKEIIFIQGYNSAIYDLSEKLEKEIEKRNEKNG